MKDKKYIDRIIKYINKINAYMEPVENKDLFKSNPEKVDAVVLNLEQIGETAKKISMATRELYDHIEWIKIIALRNLISHEYEGIDVSLIYNMATVEINDLLEQLKIVMSRQCD